MGTVHRFAFPSALICSLTMALIGFFLTANTTAPASASSSLDPSSDINAQEKESDQNSTREISGEKQKAKRKESNQEDQTSKTNGKCQVSKQYPQSIRQWCGLITLYSQTYKLEPDLIAALVWQESGGNQNAYSRSGAVGLMQVMPKDGIAADFMCKNGPCFKNRPTIQELKDPEFNVNYGTRMLSNLVNKYGNIRDALKFYGPMDVGYYYADKVIGIYQSYKK